MISWWSKMEFGSTIEKTFFLRLVYFDQMLFLFSFKRFYVTLLGIFVVSKLFILCTIVHKKGWLPDSNEDSKIFVKFEKWNFFWFVMVLVYLINLFNYNFIHSLLTIMFHICPCEIFTFWAMFWFYIWVICCYGSIHLLSWLPSLVILKHGVILYLLANCMSLWAHKSVWDLISFLPIILSFCFLHQL